MTTPIEIAAMLKHASVWWPNFKVEDMEYSVGVYMEALGPYEYSDVRKAMNSMKKSKFMPSMPEILAAVERLGDPSDNEATTQARAYWNYRDQMQFSNGSGYKPELKAEIHPEVRRVMDAVGFGEGWETRFRFTWRDR